MTDQTKPKKAYRVYERCAKAVGLTPPDWASVSVEAEK